MLELRPNCEHCATPLDPTGDDARICSFECTFCAACATWELLGICPNCGGELVTRPRRPLDKLATSPGGAEVRHAPVDVAAHQARVNERLTRGDLPVQVWTVSFANGRAPDSAGDGYAQTGDAMDALAAQQPGFIGVDSVRSDGGVGITVSRWSSVAAMVAWRRVPAHQDAQHAGRERWYDWYRSDVARVERTASFRRND